MKRFLTGLILVSLFFSCDKSANRTNKFSDPVIRKIYDLKDKRLSDSLYQFFTHESPEYRNEAVLAFASIQDSVALDKLGRLFTREADTTVRKSLAFTLGQIRNSHSERILLGALMRESNPRVLREMLEAYGKVTSHWQLIQPNFLKDTIKAEGLAWSIYRAGLNNATDSVANRIAASLLASQHRFYTRLMAAHFFARSAKNIEKHFSLLAATAEKDPSAEVRMAAASALRKVLSDECLAILVNICENEKDPRVKINALGALRSFPFNDTKRILYQSLYERNANIAVRSSEVIKEVAAEENWIEISNLTDRVQNWRVKANLYEAAMKSGRNKALVQEVQSIIRQTSNPYQRAAMIAVLQTDPASFDFVSNELLEADTAVVKSAAAAALAEMNNQEGFDSKTKLKFIELCKKVFPLGDPAVIGTLANALADSALQYKRIIKDVSFLEEAREKLSLPKDNEAVQPVEAALAYLQGKKPLPVKNDFNNPIDWALVETIPVDQEVIVKTTRGHIRLRLLVEDAPGSVSNFLKLARENYFDKKLFHRVVPNFVVQAGCNRGDGWGSEDFSIRSEFWRGHYKTGSVGMASAGKDTEGTQWFITHSPTPHLDGRYTIFAEVVEGMEVVNFIEVSDQIIDVTIVGTGS